MKTIGITGGTGFIGSYLTDILLNSAYKVIIFSRGAQNRLQKPNLSYAHWDPDKMECDITALSSVDAMIHLAGAGIADKRWIKERKNEILSSREKGTSFLVSQLKLHASNCKTFISASAIGYYGPDKENHIPFREECPAQDDFIGGVCKAWEREALAAPGHIRTVILRFGIVLGRDGGAFPKFVRPFNFGIMPILGSGNEVLSWIHIDDHCRLINFALENNTIKGVYNAVAPYPASNKELMKAIARIKGGIKILFHVHAFLLKLLLGEMSSEILKSCTVSAEKILNAGFTFRYPEIENAVKELLM